MKIPKDLGLERGRAGWADLVQVAAMADAAENGPEEVFDTQFVAEVGVETNGTSEVIDASGAIS